MYQVVDCCDVSIGRKYMKNKKLTKTFLYLYSSSIISFYKKYNIRRKRSVFATRNLHRLQLEPLSVATEEVVQYQAGALTIYNSECISIATRTTVGVQLKGYNTGGSTK
jgi:hypothetical protein